MGELTGPRNRTGVCCGIKALYKIVAVFQLTYHCTNDNAFRRHAELYPAVVTPRCREVTELAQVSREFEQMGQVQDI